MWASDPLSLKDTVRIPLELCNLPPSKKIEIEQDSGKVLIWEQSPASTSSSSPPNLIPNLNNLHGEMGLWGHHPSAYSSTSLRQSNSSQRLLIHSRNSSRLSLEMSNSVGTSSDADLSPKRASFDRLSSANKRGSSLKDDLPNYLSSTNVIYPHLDLTSPPLPLDEGVPYATDPGVLTSISNSITPPPTTTPSPNGQPKVIATLERVPAHELGFFASTPHLGHLPKPIDDASTTDASCTKLLSDQTQHSLAFSLTPNLPAHSTLRQRSATTNSNKSNHNSPLARPVTLTRQSTTSSTINSAMNSPRKRVSKLQLDRPANPDPPQLDPSQISPGLEKKRAAARLFQTQGALYPSVSNRGGVVNMNGAYERAQPERCKPICLSPTNKSAQPMLTPFSFPLFVHSSTGARVWTRRGLIKMDDGETGYATAIGQPTEVP